MKPKVEIPVRPISAVNKLHRIKKNVFPSLLYTNNIQGILNNVSIFDEHSPSPGRFQANPNGGLQANRIKSAKTNHHIDHESLLQENLSLKSNLNKVRNELAFAKKEIVNLEGEINKKDKMLDDLATETHNSMINNISRVNENYDKNKILAKANETRLIINLKKKCKEIKKEFDKKNEQYEDLKKALKATRLNEISQENAVLIEEIGKLKTLYEHSIQQNENNANMISELNAVKEINSKQEFIILNLQENLRKVQEDNVLKDLELDKLVKQKNEKTNQIFKIKKDLKFQYQINEKLINSIENIKQNSEYINMKSELEKKIIDLKKENSYYKEISDKREKRVRELEKVITQGGGQVANNNSININYFPPTSDDNQEDKVNAKLLLLQSKLIEEKNEKEKLLLLIKDLNEQLKVKAYENEPHSIRSNDAGQLIDYDYLSDHNLNEFIYVLIKNLEARRLDQNIIESRVLNIETFALLDEAKEKEFTTKAANNFVDLLQIKNQQDIKDVHSFLKTFYYNNFAMLDNKNVEEFKTKFLSLFELINFYTVEQKQNLNKSLSKKLASSKTILLNAMSFFDETKSGYITFTTLKKIMERVKLQLKHDLMEYFIFLMKSFSDDSAGLRDLKYENAFKMLDENETNQEDESETNQEEEEDDEENAIEITKEEYLAKVAEVIKKVAKTLKDSGKTLEVYFGEHVITDIKDFRAIELATLVRILRDDFNIDLNHVDIFCLFTKIKPGLDTSENFEVSESVEEIIDYDKLVMEIQSAMNLIDEEEKNFYPPSEHLDSANQDEEDGGYEEHDENRVNNSDMENEVVSEHYSHNSTSNKKLEGMKELKKYNYNKTNSNRTIDNKDLNDEDFIKLIRKFLDENNMLFERFIFLQQNKMKLNYYINNNNEKEYNRYLPLEDFQELLRRNNINNFDPYNHKYNGNIFCSNGMINLDYIKNLLNQEETKRYLAFNPDNEPSRDPANPKQTKESSRSHQTKSNRSVEESDSFRKLKNEIMADKDEGYLEEIDEGSL